MKRWLAISAAIAIAAYAMRMKDKLYTAYLERV
jgi:hypothetical protein